MCGRSWRKNADTQLKLTWLSCFLLILPLLAWNLVLGPRISDPGVISDAHSPGWLLVAENLTRILVFALPLLLPLPVKDTWSKAGLIVYIARTLVYFASWLPLLLAPGSAWSNSTLGLLAPRLTPFLSLLGIALTGGAWPYGVLSAVFIFFQTWHGIQNL
ncbi:MAG: hypothetical protein ABIJ39_04725 [Chloroflexota bacterium]